MEAVAALLRGLPLQPEESDRGDLMDAKSALFLKYFTLFMNLLNDCVDMSSEADKDISGTPMPIIRPRITAGKLTALRNATIQAMSNLLSANIDSGLMHSIDLGYNTDLQTRAAFMEVLTQILQQGTEFDTLAETVLADRFEQLVQLVTMISDKGELPIAMALANVVTTGQMDELARVLVTLFDAKHLLSPLLWNMFYREVEVSDCMQTLFRGNSLGSKIMAYCFKIYGAGYLQELLKPLIIPLLDKQIPYEVDPSRLSNKEDLEPNRKNLIALTEKVFDAIVNSANQFPPQLRSMCHCLYQVGRMNCFVVFFQILKYFAGLFTGFKQTFPKSVTKQYRRCWNCNLFAIYQPGNSVGTRARHCRRTRSTSTEARLDAHVENSAKYCQSR